MTLRRARRGIVRSLGGSSFLLGEYRANEYAVRVVGRGEHRHGRRNYDVELQSTARALASLFLVRSSVAVGV